MSCYVDALIDWGSAWLKTSRGQRRSASCHLVADSLEELHVFAARIGLKREWSQDAKGVPHYDLTPRRRARAVELGAVEVDRAGFVAVMRRLRVAKSSPPSGGSPGSDPPKGSGVRPGTASSACDLLAQPVPRLDGGEDPT